jgi:signal transduction histidine kinase
MKEYAVRFNEMAMRIEQLIQEKDELIQAVSHEFGSPLSRIRLHLSLIHQPNDGKKQRLHDIAEELDRLDELMIELMDYVQPPQVNTQAFDPIHIIKESAELALLDLNKIELNFEIQHHSNTHFQIIADPKLFQRVMDNLIRNAVEHTNKQLVVEIVDNQEHIGIFVHDDGIGIPKEHRDKVFEPFFRLKSDGTGLGLAIVHRIVEKHTGLLYIDTSFLGGAVVQVFWQKG